MSNYIPYIFLTGIALLLSTMGLWFTLIVPGIDRWSKRFFGIYFFIFLLCSLSGILEMVFQYYTVPSAVFLFLLLLETLLFTAPLPMLTIYLLHSCGESLRSSRFLRVVLALWAIAFFILVIAPVIGGFFSLMPENRYARGPLYPLFILPLIVIQLLTLAGTIKRRKRLSRKVFLAFLITILSIVISLTVLLFTDVFPLIDLSYILSALAMYSLILSDQIEQDRRHQQEIVRQQKEIARQQKEIAEQQREIAHERASVMVLQMRPHFIYNTLMSIYSLCNLEPQKARQLTLDFTNYLRRNFNAVAGDSAIPFSTELEHTRAYLAVEQAQYDDMLVVDWDTPFTHFRLPPLTLQPIVENAVKHGMDLDSDPLRISIRTRHTDSGAEIIVEDTGPGLDPCDESKPHNALQLIQQRLEMMCRGEMTIAPRKEGGTVVKLTIPE